MRVFRRQKLPSMPPLVEAPKGGEPIVFDGEEQQSIDKEIKRQYDNILKDKIIPEVVAEPVNKVFAADGLRKVVQSRLNSGDLKGAASTCLKLLGISIEPSNDWLLLAKIFALHGDVVRAKGFLDNAKNARKEYKEEHLKPMLEQTGKGGLGDLTDSIMELNKKWGGKQYTKMEFAERDWEQRVQEVQDTIKSKESK
jgi:hypothetical protein